MTRRRDPAQVSILARRRLGALAGALDVADKAQVRAALPVTRIGAEASQAIGLLVEVWLVVLVRAQHHQRLPGDVLRHRFVRGVWVGAAGMRDVAEQVGLI